MEPTIRVLVIDDHPVVRAGVVSWLSEPRSGIEVTATGESLAAAHVLPGSEADVIVLDLELADGRVGPDPIRRLVESGRRIVILTQHTEPDVIRPLIDAGAHAVLSKHEGPKFCRDAVLAAADREYSVGPMAAGLLVTDRRPGRPRLTERELEALRLLCYQLTRKEIGTRMGIDEETVTTYFKRAAAKYAGQGRAVAPGRDLMVRALEDGIVTVAEMGAQVGRKHRN